MQSRARIEGRQLTVDGTPFLIRGGELHNSSSSGPYLRDRWRRFAELELNTVLAAVPWDTVEPVEGRFDFRVVDELIEGARGHDLRLVLLWFGSWKNGSSSYVPGWVTRDPVRFPLQQRADGHPLRNLSPLSEAACHADSRAFAALLAHLREVDAADSTVLFVQVENEVGLLGAPRDHSPIGERAFTAPVPPALRAALADASPEAAAGLRVSPAEDAPVDASWEDLFGTGDATDELFSAWCYASFLERVAAAGRREYDLPLYANVWLDGSDDAGGAALSGGQRPGQYPSGGPLPQTLLAWRTAAPTLDFLAPDIYLGDFAGWAAAYATADSPLFVPEMRRDDPAVGGVYLAVGEYGAIGVSPFGIDSLSDDVEPAFALAYRQLRLLENHILAAQRSGAIRGFVLPAGEGGQYAEVEVELGGRRFALVPDLPPTPGAPPTGLLIALGDDRFVLAGQSLRLHPVPQGIDEIAVLDVEEWCEDTGVTVLRRLNGDETMAGTAIRLAPTGSTMFGKIPSSPTETGVIAFSLYDVAVADS